MWPYAPFLSGWDDRYMSVLHLVFFAFCRLLRASVTACIGYCVHQLAEAQTDLATVRDAMEATVGTEGAGGSSVTGSHILRV